MFHVSLALYPVSLSKQSIDVLSDRGENSSTLALFRVSALVTLLIRKQYREMVPGMRDQV